MKYLSKLATIFCSAAVAMFMLTGCEGSEFMNVNAPDWLQQRIDSIANSGGDGAPKIAPMVLGAKDNSDGWWGSHLAQDIKIESNKSYTTTFTNYTSGANNWNNYVVVLRQKDKTEYCCLRSDNYGWSGEKFKNTYEKCVHDNTGAADWGGWLAQMDGAKVTVTVINYGNNTCDVIANVVGNAGLESTQTYLGIPVQSSNLYLDFTTDGCHYVFDKEEVDVADVVEQQPVSMELINVPEDVNKGTSLKDFTKNIMARVTYSEGAVQEVPAKDLEFIVVPDFETLGEKYIIASLSKTLLGKVAEKTIYANAKFMVVNVPVSIEIINEPINKTYYIHSTAISPERNLEFDATGMIAEVTYSDGTKEIYNNSKLEISPIPATVGSHKVTLATNNGKTCDITINVAESSVETVIPTPASLGAVDCTTGWWVEFTNDMNIPAGKTFEINFTNYSCGANNWNNYVVILRRTDMTEYAVLRADNYGWGAGYDGNPNLKHEGTQGDWAAWLASMNGAKVKLYVTNCGNGTADIQAFVTGNDGSENTQGYFGINTIDVNDLNVAFTVDGSHLEFGGAASAKRAAKIRRR